MSRGEPDRAGRQRGGRAYLAEPKRAGNFIFDNANHAAKVAADTRQALFVAPASDATGASGAWVRQFDGAVNVSGSAPPATARPMTAPPSPRRWRCSSSSRSTTTLYYKGSAKLLVPAGHYYLGTTTLDITHTLIIEGESGIGGGISTLMRWADNTTGIRVQGHNTNGAAGTDPAPFHFSGAGSHIRNISLRGGFSGTEGEYHGIHVRAGCTIENFWIDNFPGDGIFAHTTATGGGADEGNSNGMAVRRGRITNVRDGFGIDGADANVWLVEGVDVTYARRWGVWDSSFLGNTYINVHVANAGLVPGNPPTIVHYLGNRFFVKVGQAAGASTNAPPATATEMPFGAAWAPAARRCSPTSRPGRAEWRCAREAASRPTAPTRATS
jgi:hypothetical protein